MRLEAPYPALELGVSLPSPQFSDVESRLPNILIKRSINGTRRTYVDPSVTFRLAFTFILRRHVALALREFIQEAFASKIKLTDHNDVQWVGYLTSNPFEATSAGAGFPVPEIDSIQLLFEGHRL